MEREAYSCRHGLCLETEVSVSALLTLCPGEVTLGSVCRRLHAVCSSKEFGMHLYSRHLAQNCGFKGNGRRSAGLSCESGLGVEHTTPLESRCLQGCRAPSSSEDRAAEERLVGRLRESFWMREAPKQSFEEWMGFRRGCYTVVCDPGQMWLWKT